MRDPDRIDIFCDELKELWKLVPDWRFGQLIFNLCIDENNTSSFFYKEDKPMMDKMKGTMKTWLG